MLPKSGSPTACHTFSIGANYTVMIMKETTPDFLFLMPSQFANGEFVLQWQEESISIDLEPETEKLKYIREDVVNKLARQNLSAKEIWIIEDYRLSNDGEFECYGFCSSKEIADAKVKQLNDDYCNSVRDKHNIWVAVSSIYVGSSVQIEPTYLDEQVFRAVKIKSVD